MLTKKQKRINIVLVVVMIVMSLFFFFSVIWMLANENNLYFEFGGATTVARVSKYEVCKVGDEVEFVFVPHRMHFFDSQTEEAIEL